MGIGFEKAKTAQRTPIILGRICLAILLVLSILWMPIWVTGIIALLDALFLGAWPEVLILGFLIDTVFYSGTLSLGTARHTIWALGISVITLIIRRQSRFLYGFS
jgi:hypothetical protein